MQDRITTLKANGHQVTSFMYGEWAAVNDSASLQNAMMQEIKFYYDQKNQDAMPQYMMGYETMLQMVGITQGVTC